MGFYLIFKGKFPKKPTALATLEKLRELVPVKNSKQVTNWIWIVVGILQSESSHLSQIANYLPMKKHSEAAEFHQMPRAVTWESFLVTP